MREGSITIGYIYDEHVQGCFLDSLLAFAGSPHAWRVFDPDKGGGTIAFSTTNIPAGRNEVVTAFLDDSDGKAGEWLMMLDTDHSFAVDSFERLLAVAEPAGEDGAPIVGGLAFAGGRSSKIVPTMYRVPDPGKGDGAILTTFKSWTKGAVVEVDSTGAACLLVHRRVFERIKAAFPDSAPLWWFASGVHNGVAYGEDFFFCLRAKQMGYPIYVHTGVAFPHHKAWIIDQTDFERYMQERDLYGDEQLAVAELAKRKGVPYELRPLARPPEVGMNREQRRAHERKRP